MVKFAKYLARHLVPEWRPAFCNYRNLKKDLKQIKTSRGVECRGFEGAYVALRGPSLQNIRAQSRAEVIMVHRKSSDVYGSRLDLVETELVDSDQAESEKPFFGSLDTELNKVNEFYKVKEKEFLEHANILDGQMQALFEMKLIVENRKAYDTPQHRSRGDEDLATHLRNDGSIDVMDSVVAEHNELLFQTIMNQNTMARSGLPNKDQLSFIRKQLDDIGSMSTAEAMLLSRHRVQNMNDAKEGAESSSMMSPRTLSRSQSDDISHRTPREVKRCSPQEFIAFKSKAQHSEKMLCEAFVEFYRGLGLLKSYSSLNMLAFTKILKKYEKVTERSASSTYMRMVDDSYFHTSDKVAKLIAWGEAMFTDYFANGDRRKARKALKPAQDKAPLAVTFFLGMFTGCSIMLAVAFGTVVHVLFVNMTESERADRTAAYMNSVFPIFSTAAFTYVYMYGWNLYRWQQNRINYAFIFEFAPGTELSFRDIFLLSTGLTVVLGGGMLGHLASHHNESLLIDLIPLGVVLIVFGLLFCPFHICYRSGRRFFLNCMLRIICAPFYEVVCWFFLQIFSWEIQLCSQLPLLRDLEYVICYYAGGHFKTNDGKVCMDNTLYIEVSYMISVIPYWWRLMQCLRRYQDEKIRSHLLNGGKYLSALIVVFVGIRYKNSDSTMWMVLYILSSTFATCYQIYWDIVRDWGLLRHNLVNPWLREKLILEDQRYVYFFAMGLNVILRFPWLLSITHFNFGGLDSHIADFILAAMEVFRRGNWNFYRLENEHLNNVGQYRATKTVPLPFVH